MAQAREEREAQALRENERRSFAMQKEQISALRARKQREQEVLSANACIVQMHAHVVSAETQQDRQQHEHIALRTMRRKRRRRGSG